MWSGVESIAYRVRVSSCSWISSSMLLFPFVVLKAWLQSKFMVPFFILSYLSVSFHDKNHPAQAKCESALLYILLFSFGAQKDTKL